MPIVSPALFLGSTIAVSAIVLLFMAGVAWKRPDLANEPLLIPCVFLLLVGEVLYMLQIWTYPGIMWIAYLAFLLIGVGGALILLLWGRAFCMLEVAELMPTLALAFVIGGLIDFILHAIPFSMEATIEAVIMVMVSAVPLEWLLRPRLEASQGAGGSDSSVSQTSRPLGSLRSFLAATWKSSCGALLCLVIIACRWGTAVGTPDFGGMESYYQWQMMGFAVAALILFVLSLALAKRNATLEHLLRFIPVVSAALLILAWFLVLIDKQYFLETSSAMTGAATSWLCCIAWRDVVLFARSQRSPLVYFGVGGGIIFLICILFALIAGVMVETAEYVVPVLCVVYLVMSNFSFGANRLEREATQAQDAVEATSETVDALVSTYHLSPREAEVLPLLAQGHSASFIADELCISLNTVKTHTRRVYDKLGVHTRDELITLIKG